MTLTIGDLVRRKHDELNTAKGRHAAAIDRYNAIASRLAEIREMPHISAETEAEIRRLRSEKEQRGREADTHRERVAELTEEYTQLKAEQIADERVAELQSQRYPTPAAKTRHDAQEGTVSIASFSVREPRTYSAERAHAGDTSFLRDLWSAQVRNDPDAHDRLRRHGEEQRTHNPGMVDRVLSTGGVAGFTPPQYLVDLWADYARAGRPIANLCNRSIPLPETGMTAYLPRLTTPTSTGVQASEGSTLANQDPDDTLLAAPVVTIGGYVDVTWQALERGLLVEDVVFQDLAADYAVKLDAQVIAGTGLSGQHTGVLTVSGTGSTTYTDASPTLVEAFPSIASMLGKVASVRYTGATAIVMRPNVWFWMLGQLGTDNRPLITAESAGPVNAMGVGASVEYVESVGTLLSVPVVLDGSIPADLGAGTNETRLIAADWRDVYLLEENGGAPTQLRFDAPLAHQATTRLVAYGYSALFAGRQPAAVSVLSGTGLVIP
jgi:HK97 family phage major capsid protein